MENNPGGNFHFEIALMMRNVFFIASVFSCSEVWYNVLENEIRKLEPTDDSLLRKILNCSSQVTTEMLYLDLRIMPIRHINGKESNISAAHIEAETTKLIFQFLIAQMKTPQKSDWATQTFKDLVTLEIKIELVEIEEMEINKFKDIIKEKLKIIALKYLDTKKKNNKSVKHIVHDKLKMTEYLDHVSADA